MCVAGLTVKKITTQLGDQGKEATQKFFIVFFISFSVESQYSNVMNYFTRIEGSRDKTSGSIVKLPRLWLELGTISRPPRVCSASSKAISLFLSLVWL